MSSTTEVTKILSILKFENQAFDSMVKKLLIGFTSILLAQASLAQYNWELGMNIGAGNYLGEFGGGSGKAQGFVADINLDQTGYAFGVFTRNRVSKGISLCLGIDIVQLHGADSLSTNPARAGRNLSFKNVVKELTLKTEFNVYTLYDVGRMGRSQVDFHAYFFTGFTVFMHNPQAEYKGVTYDLQPMKLEGQTEPYSLTGIAIPTGFGLTYTFNNSHRLGAEIGWRITFTDYLDDASAVYAHPSDLKDDVAIALSNRRPELGDKEGIPAGINYGIIPSSGESNIRGNPKNNDHYLVANFTYSFVIKGHASNFRKNYRRRLYGSRRRRTKMKL